MNEKTKRMINDMLTELNLSQDKRRVIEILCESCFIQGSRQGLLEGKAIMDKVFEKKANV